MSNIIKDFLNIFRTVIIKRTTHSFIIRRFRFNLADGPSYQYWSDQYNAWYRWKYDATNYSSLKEAHAGLARATTPSPPEKDKVVWP